MSNEEAADVLEALIESIKNTGDDIVDGFNIPAFEKAIEALKEQGNDNR